MAQKPARVSSSSKPIAKTAAIAEPAAMSATADLPVRLDAGHLSEGAKKLKNAATLLIAIGVVGLSSFERPLCIFLVLSLLPSVLGWFMDQTRNQDLIRTIFPLNASSSLPFALQLWHSPDKALKLGQFLVNPFTWITLYAAALLGFLLYYMSPMFIKLFVSRQIENKRISLQEKQNSLCDEWGNEVKI